MEALTLNNHGNKLERQNALEYIRRKNVVVNKTLKPSARQLSVVKVKNKALECIYSCVDNKSGIFLCYAMLFPDHTEYIVYHPSTT